MTLALGCCLLGMIAMHRAHRAAKDQIRSGTGTGTGRVDLERFAFSATRTATYRPQT